MTDEFSADNLTPEDGDDAALLALLGRALELADPVPPHVIAAARGAVAWRTIDQELADLVFDSALEATGVRDRDAARQLTFRGPGVEIEVMLADATQRRLIGQLVPAQAATVRLEATDGVSEQTADRFGRFTFDLVPTGPVRLTVLGPQGPGAGVATDWVLF